MAANNSTNGPSKMTSEAVPFGGRGPREVRIRITGGHIHPAMAEMAAVQLLRQVGLGAVLARY
jgi:hypothetical protein